MRLAYDATYDPPAPVALLRISAPAGGDAGVMLRGLLDSGADCTLIPVSLAEGLRLPRVGHMEITGVGGGGGTVPVHAARVELARVSVLARLVAFGTEMIVGRDLLNRLVVLLDGPELMFQILDRERGRPL